MTLFNQLKEFIDRNFRYVPPLFLTMILLIGHFSYGIFKSQWTILAAIGTSVFVELIMGRIFTGKWKNLSSAYISGISVGILVRSTMIWPYMVTAAISIMTKYLFRYKGQHIFNPSNFAISWMLIAAPYGIAILSVQWGNDLLPMTAIWIAGLVIVWRARRLHITVTYVLSYVLFAWIRSILIGGQFLTELSPLTGPMYQLFIFFMITDPPTNVRSKKGQILVAFLVAALEFVLRMNHFIYAPFYALFIVGPIAKLLDLKFDFSGQTTRRTSLT